MHRNYLKSFIKLQTLELKSIPPKTRDEKFLGLLADLRKKSRYAPRPIVDKDLLNEFFDWFLGLQIKLNLTNKEFASKLGVTTRMLTNYKARKFTPHEIVFKRALRLEKLTKYRITIVKNKISFIKIKPIHVIYI